MVYTLVRTFEKGINPDMRTPPVIVFLALFWLSMVTVGCQNRDRAAESEEEVPEREEMENPLLYDYVNKPQERTRKAVGQLERNNRRLQEEFNQ